MAGNRHSSYYNPYIQNDIDGEVWKPIQDFEDCYQISDKGRLRSKSNGRWIVLSNINTKGDYFSVVLRDKERKRSCRIHRLVYETFVGKILKGSQIHHIDGNKQNNHVENLRMVTPLEHAQEHYIHRLESLGSDIENTHDSYKYQIKRGKVLGLNPNYNPRERNLEYIPRDSRGRIVIAKHKRVAQYDLNVVKIAEYETAADAYRVTGVCARNILQVANQTPYNDKGLTRKQAGGFIWKFAD